VFDDALSLVLDLYLEVDIGGILVEMCAVVGELI
jgi:hypothetical protein